MLSKADLVHITVLCSIDCSAILANVIMITLIVTRTPHVMRSYSILLFNSAFIDIISATFSLLSVSRPLLSVMPTRRITWLISFSLYIPTITMMALTYQMMLPIGVTVACVFWLIGVFGIFHPEILERIAPIMTSLFALGSPIINMIFLPPYRRVFGRRNSVSHIKIASCSSS
ncbi:hypothetical protein PFISCL1PPCAC_13589, partial [Pristionchus fissidentatus]